MTQSIELEKDELRKVKGAMWELYDRHKGDGNREVAQEYKEIYDKLQGNDNE